AEQSFRRAEGLYEELARQSPGTPAYRRSLAGICYSLASQHDWLGRTADAEQGYRRSLAWAGPQPGGAPAAPALRPAAASSARLGLARLLWNTGRRHQAEQEMRAALDEADAEVKRRPRGEEAVLRLARCQVVWAMFLEAKGDFAGAEKAHAAAVQLRDGLAA